MRRHPSYLKRLPGSRVPVYLVLGDQVKYPASEPHRLDFDPSMRSEGGLGLEASLENFPKERGGSRCLSDTPVFSPSATSQIAILATT